MKKQSIKQLVGERLHEFGCGEIPAVVRAEIELEVSTAWQEEATRLVKKIVTPKRVATTFAASLGLKRIRGVVSNLPSGLPPLPPSYARE